MQAAVVFPDRRRRWPKFDWIVSAIRRLGHGCRVVRSLEDLEAADRESDLVLFEQYSAGLNDADVVELSKHKQSFWVQWWFDLIVKEPLRALRDQGRVKSLLPMMQAMDMVLVKERAYIDAYKALGIKARWFDQACPSDLGICEHREIPEWDVLVFGTFDRSQRRSDVNFLVDAGYSVAWAGDGGTCPPGVMPLEWTRPFHLPKLASRAAVVLGVDERSDIEGYCSDRFWLAAGMGACVLYRKGKDNLPHLPGVTFYRTQPVMMGIVEVLRADRETREKLGQQAAAAVHKGHLYDHRLSELIELVLSKRLQRTIHGEGERKESQSLC